MASRPTRRSSPLSLIAVIVAGMFAALIGPLAPAFSGPSIAEPLSRAERADFVWSKPQVRELIDEIAAARAHGLDPSDYGLDALKGELVQTGELLEAGGGRQLDILADTAALALAGDYRAGRSSNGQFDWHDAPARAVGRDELRQALRRGQLRAWLRSLRPSAPSN
jgi:murein L,D-transpeptidase YcbB/YkuD